jgi:hypothetical protein
MSLCILKALNPKKYEEVRASEIGIPALRISEVAEFFQMVPETEAFHGGLSNDLYHAWQYYFDPSAFHSRFPDRRGVAIPSVETRNGDFHRLIKDHLETFQLPVTTP